MFVFFFAVLSVPCSHVVTCWERTDLLALICVMCHYGVSDQVRYLIARCPTAFAFLITSVGIVVSIKYV